MDKRSRRKPTTRTTRTTLVTPVTNESITEPTIKPSSTIITDDRRSSKMGRKPTKDKEEKKIKRLPIKERWLLTRKTWKYMTDAGRRLIPEGVSNRTEDIPKIEDYFQQVCRSESRFLPWRRKASYPGAFASLRRKRKPKNIYSPPKASSADEAEDERDDTQRLLVMIEMLERFLNIKNNSDELHAKVTVHSSSSEQPSFLSSSDTIGQMSIKDNDALSTVTGTGGSRLSATQQEPCDTFPGPSYVSPTQKANAKLKENWFKKSCDTSTGLGSISGGSYQSVSGSGQISTGSSISNLDNKTTPTWTSHTSLLLESLRNYSRTSQSPLLRQQRITSEMLHDKRLLRKIRDELKQQQIMKLLRHHSSSSSLLNLPRVTSPSTTVFNFWHKENRDDKLSTSPKTSSTNTTKRDDLPINTSSASSISDVNRLERIFTPLVLKKNIGPIEVIASTHIQTDSVPIALLYDWRDEFNKKKFDSCGPESPTGKTNKHSRRKSSIDNEDVSQSVSDTIKRYLKMARKKNVNDNDANRFKRVNYDQAIRNIKPKGEITMPGDDDGDSKGTQTDDNWICNVIDEIEVMGRDRLSPESTDDEFYHSNQSADRSRFQYSKRVVDKMKSSSTSPSQSSPPSPSPSGLLNTSTQFLTNFLWHGHASSDKQRQRQQQSSDYNNSFNALTAKTPSTTTTTIATPSVTTPTMQKSKSSSSIGQSFAKKIWSSRSKSKNRLPTSSVTMPSKPHWTPQGRCVWTSLSGRKVNLKETNLQDLTDVETESLYRVAIDKIHELNIGVQVNAPNDGHSHSSINTDTVPTKPQKKRPMLLRRKAFTTGIFDTLKTKEKEKSEPVGGLVFGLSLEKCVDNDNKSKSIGSSTGNREHLRSARNSLTSLRSVFGSCESLPNRDSQSGSSDDNKTKLTTSLSHMDIRRGSQDENESTPPGIHRYSNKQVPALVIACIQHLETYGLDKVGIFRVSTSKRRLRQLREDFDNGTITTLDSNIGPHESASLLKEYFRDLPEPLLCTNLYKAFLETQKIRNRRLQLEAISHLIQLLPVAHRDTLYELLKFLGTVSKNADDVRSPITGSVVRFGNKMDSSNLATVIAPNILRLTKTEQETATEAEVFDGFDVINVVRIMIDHVDELFVVPADVMDDIYTKMMDLFPQQLDYLLEKNCRDESDFSSSESSKPTSPTSPKNFIDDSTRTKLEFGDHQQSITGIYTRKDLTHEIPANSSHSNGTELKRESQSNMKYQNSDHDLSRRRRRNRVAAASNYDTPTAYHSHSSQSDSKDSSLPVVLQDHSATSGILSASLKLPLQVQFQDEKTNINLAPELQNIPYIEDSSSSGELLLSSDHQHQATISSPSLGQITRSQSKKHIESMTLPKSITLQKSPSSPPFSSSLISSSIQPPPVPHHTEPKLSPSITNIGGAVMRSKTADFERLLLQNKSPRKLDQHTVTTTVATTTATVAATTTTATSSTTSATASTETEPLLISGGTKVKKSDSIKRTGPIYKRQELIASTPKPKKSH